MGRDWIELSAKGPRSAFGQAVFILVRAGSPGVIEENTGLPKKLLVSHSMWEDETKENPDEGRSAACKAYLPAGAPEAIDILRDELKAIGWRLKTSEFKDQDWTVKWKARLKPIRLSFKKKTVIVKPTWKPAPKIPGAITIEIDPGMAFGTGSHATTKMCLRAILELTARPEFKRLPSAMLDVGTGTGILAIAGRLLNIKKAVATDIDKVAIKAAAKNSKINRTKITFSSRPVEAVRGRYSLITANILAGELKRMSGALETRLNHGGFLVLSGILRDEAAAVEAAFTAHGLSRTRRLASNEWRALVFKKP